MSQEITPEQANQITDIDSYKRVLDVKRFKRTKDEMERQLTVEQALAERLAEARAELPQGQMAQQYRQAPRQSGTKTGEFLIRVVPKPGVAIDQDYQLPTGEVCIEVDDKTYSWLDESLRIAYRECEDPAHTLIKHIFDLGLGEVIVNIQRTKDVEEHERMIYE